MDIHRFIPWYIHDISHFIHYFITFLEKNPLVLTPGLSILVGFTWETTMDGCTAA